MYRNYKVVANTAVGRRRYLKYLLPQVLVSDIVDRYDLWVNTIDKVDIAFFQAMANKFSKLNLIWQPKGEINGIYSMSDFYPFCQDEDTIYIKLDDDIIWFDPSFFEKICCFRIENPQFFLVSPLVINNGICTYLLQNSGHLKFYQYFTCQGYDICYYNGYLAKELHDWFINNFLLTNKYQDLYVGEHCIALQRFAINAVAWFGSDFKKFGGKVIGDDEEFLTIIYPARNNLLNCFNCNTIVSHFSFSVQREYLDSTDLLFRYEQVLRKNDNQNLVELLNQTEEIINKINSETVSINSLPLPRNYKKTIQVYSKKRILLEKIIAILKIPKVHRRKIVDIYLSVVKGRRKYLNTKKT